MYTWQHDPRLIEYLGYDPFVSCGLRDPYGNEPPGVAFLSSGPLEERIRARRLELKLTVKKCAQILKVDAKTVHGWEKDKHQPGRSMQKRLIEFLDWANLLSSA